MINFRRAINTTLGFWVIILLGGVTISCGSTSKTPGTEAERQKLDELVSEKALEIRSDWALPMATNSLNSVLNAGLLPPGSSAGQINLIGNSNYLKIMGDSVAAYLPYFGERQMGGGYNNDGPGIEFEGVPDEMEIDKDAEKQRYNIQFQMRNDTETFNVGIILFSNMNSSININSSQRFPIRYSGTVRAIENDSQ